MLGNATHNSTLLSERLQTTHQLTLSATHRLQASPARASFACSDLFSRKRLYQRCAPPAARALSQLALVLVQHWLQTGGVLSQADRLLRHGEQLLKQYVSGNPNSWQLLHHAPPSHSKPFSLQMSQLVSY
jgi:hypothetical protein